MDACPVCLPVRNTTSIPKGVLLLKKSDIDFLAEAGTPSASFISTAKITLPYLGVANSSPPKARTFCILGNSLLAKIYGVYTIKGNQLE